MINLGISFINKSLVIINLSGYFSVYPKQTLTYRLMGGLGTGDSGSTALMAGLQPLSNRTLFISAKSKSKGKYIAKAKMSTPARRRIGKCWQYPLFEFKD